MDILKVIGTMKKGKSTSEFIVMIIGGLVTGGIGTGLFDWMTPENTQALVEGAKQAASTVQAVQGGEMTFIEGLIRIVGLVVGGQILSSYIKSRGDSKSSHMMALAQAIAAEKLKGTMIEPETLLENEISITPRGSENDKQNP